ncbi:MAG: saccharopine dehydrogenase NADP-binding domain-containing protein [Bacteroidia bacterium]|nr:saccharopine dehydrogenase NADP-binding domain-containing protein [Bacteroidia bacterium]
MKKILVIGAGRSATDLISYLLNHAAENQWQVTVGDMDVALAAQKTGEHPFGKAIELDGGNEAQLDALLPEFDVIVSLLPPPMHPLVASLCLRHKKHLVTASYISPAMAAFHEEAQASDLIFLNELGADPGIDHMNVMKGIHTVRQAGGKIVELKSYCGSLIAPESNDNPWGYKFTWSPMNVILAGQGAANYLRNGKRAFIPYNRLFSVTDSIEVEGYGAFEAYANRDSYSYIQMYDIPEVKTLIRGTLRMKGYCEGWNALIKIGLTANDYRITDSERMTHKEWAASYIPAEDGESLTEALARFLNTESDSGLMKRLESAGILDDTPVTRPNATPAEILYDLLMKRWVFQTHDKDMLVMADKILYEKDGKRYEKTATMAVIGKDYHHTAISQTVGLPAAMGVKLILQGKITGRGVLAPVTPDIYLPVLEELTEYGIVFSEKTVTL